MDLSPEAATALIETAEACAVRSVETLDRTHPRRTAFADYLEMRGVSWALDWRQLDAVTVAEAVRDGVRAHLADNADASTLARIDALLAHRAGQLSLDL